MQAGAVNVRYWAVGDRGTPVILLHGGGGSAEFWIYNIHALGQQHRVYALDMVGAGRSDKPVASYSLTYQAQFIKDFIDTLNLERVTLIGNSMGGGTALQFALLFPQRLDRLVLVDSFALGREIAPGLRLTALPGVVQLLRPSRRMLMAMLKHNFHQPTRIAQAWLDLRYPLFAMTDRKPALAQIARTNLSLLGVRAAVYRPIVRQLANITAPTLIVWGQQDRILPVAHAYVAAKAIPNSRLHIFEDCGHHPHLECPEAFNQLVLQFLFGDRAG